MQLTAEQIDQARLHLPTFISELQARGRAVPRQAFTMGGPCRLNVKLRPRGVQDITFKDHNFIGGERFTLESVETRLSDMDDSVQIAVRMTSASASLAKENIAGLLLPLEEAIDKFDGLEEFVHHALTASCSAHGIDPTQAIRLGPEKVAPTPLTEAQLAVRGSW